ncbi:hypothetical protein GCT19_39060 [Paraburkholderia sp. CNPSo 3155]|nr:hypothetical protein [Paraburkholderia atlantica]
MKRIGESIEATGYAMAEAQGYAWACNCRGRSGNQHGVTDHAGRTARYRTRGGQQLATFRCRNPRLRQRRITEARFFAQGIYDATH